MEKQSKIWGYHENSFLTRGWIRTTNYILVIILTISTPSIEPFLFKTNIIEFLWWILISVIIGSLLAIYLTEKNLKHTEFFEWDYTERKKKVRFILTVMFFATFFSVLSIISFAILKIEASINGIEGYLDTTPVIIILIRIATPIIFMFNSVKCVDLFYYFFESDLNPAYKIQVKPKNWITDGEEIKDENEIKEIIKRDWGIDM